jgi:hypothetical protein
MNVREMPRAAVVDGGRCAVAPLPRCGVGRERDLLLNLRPQSQSGAIHLARLYVRRKATEIVIVRGI